MLFLSWIPRYCIFIIILVVSIFVYRHVGDQFQSFHSAWSVNFKPLPKAPNVPNESLALKSNYKSRQISFHDFQHDLDHDLSPKTKEMPKAKRKSTFRPQKRQNDRHPLSQSISQGERGHDMNTVNLPVTSVTEEYSQSENFKTQVRDEITIVDSGSLYPGEPRRISAFSNKTSSTNQTIKTIPLFAANQQAQALSQGLSKYAIDSSIDAKRQQMLNQLRATFIYPTAYVILWLVPFVLHLLEYVPKYALDPPIGLIAANTFSIGIMGSVNAVCFLIREKPWLNAALWPDFLRRLSDEISRIASIVSNNTRTTTTATTATTATNDGVSPLIDQNPYFRDAKLSTGGSSGVKTFQGPNLSTTRMGSARKQAFDRLARERSDRLRILSGHQANISPLQVLPQQIGTPETQSLPELAVSKRYWFDNENLSIYESEPC